MNLFDGGSPVGSATVGANGVWQITTTALTEGQHSLTATESDLAGDTSAQSLALVITIDTAPPGELVLFGSAGLIDGGAGDNVIFVFGGGDTVTGGGGNNQVYIDADDVLTDGPVVFHDTVIGFSQSQGDSIHLTADTAADALAHSTQVNQGADTLISLANGSTILLKGVGSIGASFFS